MNIFHIEKTIVAAARLKIIEKKRIKSNVYKTVKYIKQFS